MPTRDRVAGFRSVLCAVDFSPASSSALRIAAEMVRRRRGHLTVLYVEPLMLGVGAAAAGYDSALLRKNLIAQVRRRAGRVADAAGLTDADWSIVVTFGQPAPRIIAFARRLPADVIVMGTNGRTGAAKLFFGSVTEAVLRRAPRPVLVVPPRRTAAKAAPRRPVIAAVEIGPYLRGDVRRVVRAARSLDAPLILLHVVRQAASSPPLASQLEREERRSVAAARRRLAAAAAGAGARIEVALGHPDEQIPAVALSKDAAAIILVLRRGRGLFGPRQGTTSYHVLCASPVPVLALVPDAG